MAGRAMPELSMCSISERTLATTSRTSPSGHLSDGPESLSGGRPDSRNISPSLAGTVRLSGRREVFDMADANRLERRVGRNFTTRTLGDELCRVVRNRVLGGRSGRHGGHAAGTRSANLSGPGESLGQAAGRDRADGIAATQSGGSGGLEGCSVATMNWRIHEARRLLEERLAEYLAP